MKPILICLMQRTQPLLLRLNGGYQMNNDVYSHCLNDSLVVLKLPGSDHCYAGVTDTDGLYYVGMGENARRAVADCFQHIADNQPSLRRNQRMIYTDPRDRRIWEANIESGAVQFDRITGRSEVATHLLPTGYLILKLADKQTPPKRYFKPLPAPAPSLPTAPAPVRTPGGSISFWTKYNREHAEPEVCGLCGGDPNDYLPHQIDVDRFECKNSRG